MDALYSLKDIRQALEAEGCSIPDGTLRNYRDTFLDLLVFQGKGRFIKYHEDSIRIFKRIRQLRSDEHLDNHEIRARIINEFGQSISPGSVGEQARCDEAGNFIGASSRGTTGAGIHASAGDLEELSGQVKDIQEKTQSLCDTNEQILQYLKEKLHRNEELTVLMKRNLELRMSELQSAMLEIRGDVETIKSGGVPPDAHLMGPRHLGAAATTGDYEDENFPNDKPRSFFDRIMKL